MMSARTGVRLQQCNLQHDIGLLNDRQCEHMIASRVDACKATTAIRVPVAESDEVITTAFTGFFHLQSQNPARTQDSARDVD